MHDCNLAYNIYIICARTRYDLWVQQPPSDGADSATVVAPPPLSCCFLLDRYGESIRVRGELIGHL